MKGREEWQREMELDKLKKKGRNFGRRHRVRRKGMKMKKSVRHRLMRQRGMDVWADYFPSFSRDI